MPEKRIKFNEPKLENIKVAQTENVVSFLARGSDVLTLYLFLSIFI